VPYTPPTPQTLADLVVRCSQRRDYSPPVPRRRPTPPSSPVSAIGNPKVVGISSEPPPVPPRHRQSLWRPRRRQHPRGSHNPRRCVPHPFSLSLSCLDKIRLPRPNLCGSDREFYNGIRATNLLAKISVRIKNTKEAKGNPNPRKEIGEKGRTHLFLRVLGVAGTPIQSRVDFSSATTARATRGFQPGASPRFLFSETRARPMKTVGPLRGTWWPRSCHGLGSGS
jgi:hypothetical protein